MNIADTSKVLAKCAAIDQRTVGEADVLAWSEILPDWIELEDALKGVADYYRSNTPRIMPANVIRKAIDARAHRTGERQVEL